MDKWKAIEEEYAIPKNLSEEEYHGIQDKISIILRQI